MPDNSAQCFLLGSFLGAFKADALIARGQARCFATRRKPMARRLTDCTRSTLSGAGAQKRWKEEKAQYGDGSVFVLESTDVDAPGEDGAEQ